MYKNISLGFIFVYVLSIIVPMYSMARKNGDAYLQACLNGNLTAVKRYIRNGGNKNFAYDKEDWNACQCAAIGGQLEVLKYLVTQKCDEGLSKSRTSFHLAAKYGHHAIVQWYVVDRKVDVNMSTSTGVTPLHCACLKESALSVLDFLSDISTVNINQPDKGFLYPVHYAIEAGNLKALHLLLDKGADLHVIHRGMTLLHFAAKQNKPHIIEFLVDQKEMNLEVQTMDYGLCTPFHIASLYGSIQAGKMLKSKGANVHATNNRNANAFIMACRFQQIDFATMLLPHIDVNGYFGTCCKKTALYKAVEEGNFKTVKFLLDHNADDTLEASLCKEHNQPKTVIDLAYYASRYDIINYLKQTRLAKITTQELLDEENEERLKKDSLQKADTKNVKMRKKRKKNGVAVPAKSQQDMIDAVEMQAQETDRVLTTTADKTNKEFSDFVSLRNDKPGFKQTFIFLYKSKTIGLFTEDSENKNMLIACSQFVDNIGSVAAQNFLLNADYSPHVKEKEKLHTDHYHNPTRTIDQKYGDWARVIVHDFKCNPAKKEYWANQLGTENVKDFWFELHSSISARIHKDKYSEDKARNLGPIGEMQYVILAENLTETGKRVVVHRCFKHDGK